MEGIQKDRRNNPCHAPAAFVPIHIIASIEDAAVIQKILSHLRLAQPLPSAMVLPQQGQAPRLAGLPGLRE